MRLCVVAALEPVDSSPKASRDETAAGGDFEGGLPLRKLLSSPRHHHIAVALIMAAEILTKALPNIDPPILSYLSDYIDDPTAHLESNQVILDTVSSLLTSFLRASYDTPDEAQAKVDEISRELEKLLPEDAGNADGGDFAADGPMRLENVIEMRKIGALNTRGHNVLTGGNIDVATGSVARATTIDVKKLEKQEAKTRAKLQKRAQRDLYESSALVDQVKRQKELDNYEEMFTSVNTLETVGSKGKNKDINLPGIDLNFGEYAKRGEMTSSSGS